MRTGGDLATLLDADTSTTVLFYRHYMIGSVRSPKYYHMYLEYQRVLQRIGVLDIRKTDSSNKQAELKQASQQDCEVLLTIL